MPYQQPTDQVVYRLVVGFPDYLIGTDGSLWSRMTTNKARRRSNGEAGRRPSVCLTRDGKQYRRQVHRLLLEAFVGPCPPGLMGLHQDDDPNNNCLSNLYYGTRRQNSEDARRNGRMVRGSGQWNAKLTEAKVRRLRRLWRAGWRGVALGKKFGVSSHVAWKAAVGRTWKHVKE